MKKMEAKSNIKSYLLFDTFLYFFRKQFHFKDVKNRASKMKKKEIFEYSTRLFAKLLLSMFISKYSTNMRLERQKKWMTTQHVKPFNL